MRVLITGGTGLLGKALIEGAGVRAEIVATYVGNYELRDNDHVRYRQLDIRDADAYRDVYREFKPDITIHTAGIGSPDYAETNPEFVLDVNLNGTRNIIDMCERFDSRFVFISSNGIYDGDNAPYAEDDRAEPVNYYGVVKLKGEEVTRKANVPFAIVRPILMYGWPFPFERGNIVTLAISRLRKGERVHAYDDVFSNPLLHSSCAEAIWSMINAGRFDVYNIAGADRASVYELLVKITEIFDLDKDLISPVQQGFFNELARRPSDTCFRTEKMERDLGVTPLPLERGLRLMKEGEESYRS